MTRKRKSTGKRPQPRGNQRQRLERELQAASAAAASTPASHVLTIQLTEVQDRYLKSRSRGKGFVAGRGAGKTYVGSLDILVRAMEESPGRVYAAYSPTYSLMRDVAMRDILNWGDQLGVVQKVNLSDMNITLTNRSEILLRSAEPYERTRGLSLSGVWLDEASYMTERFYLALLGSLREKGRRGWLSATFTPRGKKHWTYRRFVERENFDLVHASTGSNVFLHAEYEKELREEYPSSFAQQEIDGLFIDTDGAIFKEEWFGPEVIVDSAPVRLTRWVRYWDLAASQKTQADYTASIAGAFDENGILWLRDLLWGKWEWPEQRKLMARTIKAESALTIEHGIEQALHGIAAVQELSRDVTLAGRTAIRGIIVDRDKISRALPLASLAEKGKLRLVRGPWNMGFIDELCSFGGDPPAEHDDRVDAASGVLQMLSRSRSRRLVSW